MQFKDVVGQKDLKQKMIQLVNARHLPHAILFQGNDGGGGLPLALALAQYVFCEDKKEGDSCGVCSACIKVSGLQHADLHFSFPTVKPESEKLPPVSTDYLQGFREFVLSTPYENEQAWLESIGFEKQGNITARECREIIRKLTLRAFESEFKILIMWYPERLGLEGNILLKQIEEPTSDTLLLYVTTQPEQILPTIRSRTQAFTLQNLSEQDITKALIRSGCETTRASQIAKFADGNYNYALRLMHEEGNDTLSDLRQWLNAMYTNKGIDLVQWIQTISDRSKEYQKQYLLYSLQIFEHLLRLTYHSRLELPEAEQKVLENLHKRNIHHSAISEIAKHINQAIFALARNANGKILFHALSLRVQQILLEKKRMQNA